MSGSPPGVTATTAAAAQPARQGTRLGRLATRVRRLGSAGPLTVADQAVSSASNALLALLVAHRAPGGFAGFSVCFVALTLALGLSRAVNADLFVVQARAADRRHGPPLHQARVALHRSLLTGALAGGALLVPLSAWRGWLDIGLAFLLVAPAVLAHDTLRYVAWAGGRPGQALRLDAAWLLLFALLGAAATEPWQLVLAWGSGAAVPAALVALRGGLWAPALALHRLRADLGAAWRFLLEFVAWSSSVPVVSVVLLAVADDAEVTAFRGAITVLGFATTLMVGVVAFVFTQVPAEGSLRRQVAAGVAAVGVLGLAGAVALQVLPVGRWLLADVWPLAEPVVPLAAGYSTAAAMGATAAYALRGRGLGALTTRPAVVAGIGHVAAGSLGGWAAGATGASLGLLLSFTAHLAVLLRLAWGVGDD